MRIEDRQLPTIAFNKNKIKLESQRKPRKGWKPNIKYILNKHRNSTTESTHLVLGGKLKLPPLRLTSSMNH